MLMRVSLLPALAVLMMLATRPAFGQVEELLYDPREITEGVAIGLRGTFLTGMSAAGEGQFEGIDVATTWGSGFGALLGYGITPRLLLFASVDHTVHDSDNARIAGDITLYHFDFGARYHWHLRDVRFVPYASLALGGKQLYTRTFIDTLGVSRRATINARAVIPGAGMQFFFTENFALDGGVAVSVGSFGKIDVEGSGRRKFESSGGRTTRLTVGLSWYPDD